MCEGGERFLIPSRIDQDHCQKQPGFARSRFQLQCPEKAAQRFLLVLELLVFLKPKLDPSCRIIRFFFHLQTKEVAVIGPFVCFLSAALQMPKMMNKEIRYAEFEARRGDLRFHQFVYASSEENVGATAEQAAILVNEKCRSGLGSFMPPIVLYGNAIP